MKRIHRLFVLLTITGLGVMMFHGIAVASGPLNLQALLSQRVPVLLEFGRGWCKPCKYMKPILDDISRVYAGKAVVTAVEMDANADLVRSFGIRMMPTQIFLAPDGKEFFRHEGILEREQIAQIFSRMGVAPPKGVRGTDSPDAVAQLQQGLRTASR
ncbi:MAG: thioredoxin family protein [Pseudomonadota bacterium]